jgi:hypothetical protein
MSIGSERSLRALAFAMPVVFAAHVAEEAPNFVAWFNSLVSPGITQQSFLSVNAVGLAITIGVAIVLAISAGPGSVLLAIAWLGFLMLANAIVHIMATLVIQRYSPGVVTATLLYLPLFFLLLRSAARNHHISWPRGILVAILAGVPMYIHGYLIVFRGSRLF